MLNIKSIIQGIEYIWKYGIFFLHRSTCKEVPDRKMSPQVIKSIIIVTDP